MTTKADGERGNRNSYGGFSDGEWTASSSHGRFADDDASRIPPRAWPYGYQDGMRRRGLRRLLRCHAYDRRPRARHVPQLHELHHPRADARGAGARHGRGGCAHDARRAASPPPRSTRDGRRVRVAMWLLHPWVHRLDARGVLPRRRWGARGGGQSALRQLVPLHRLSANPRSDGLRVQGALAFERRPARGGPCRADSGARRCGARDAERPLCETDDRESVARTLHATRRHASSPARPKWASKSPRSSPSPRASFRPKRLRSSRASSGSTGRGALAGRRHPHGGRRGGRWERAPRGFATRQDAPRLCLAANPQPRHRRRKYRDGLADWRPAAGAARARCVARARESRRGAPPSAFRVLRRLS